MEVKQIRICIFRELHNPVVSRIPQNKLKPLTHVPDRIHNYRLSKNCFLSTSAKPCASDADRTDTK